MNVSMTPENATNYGGNQDLTYPLELLFQQSRKNPDRLWLNQPDKGTLRTWTWRQAESEIGRVAAALLSMGWPKGSRIAISGRNTAHWFMADLAAQWAGLVTVGLYPKQSPETTRYILEHSNTVAIFLGPGDDNEQLIGTIPDHVMTIRMPYGDAPCGSIGWEQMLEIAPTPPTYERPAGGDLMTLIYTSGTTGRPKGVMMSYSAIGWVTRAFIEKLPPSNGHDRLFSYLPLAHLLERAVIEIGGLSWGAEVHFLESLDKLSEQLPKASPTRFVAVPLVWTRFRTIILSRIPQRQIDLFLKIPLLSQLLRRMLLKKLGLHRVQMAISGAAAISADTLIWFQKVLGIEILEGYGMTENGAYVSLALPNESRPGTVGRPFPDAGFRLSPEGEIQVLHPGIMTGYFRNEEETKLAFTADGWLRTGDKGHLDKDGFLYITGRLKDIFKTAKGKYVAPSPIESIMAKNLHIDQLCLLGSQLNQPVMVITLAPESRAVSQEKVAQSLTEDLYVLNQTIESHERVDFLYIANTAWTIDNGMLTPTLKVRRSEIEQHYHRLIKNLSERNTFIVWEKDELLK